MIAMKPPYSGSPVEPKQSRKIKFTPNSIEVNPQEPKYEEKTME